MQARTNLGMSLGQMLTGAFDPTMRMQGMRDAAAVAQAQSNIEFNNLRAETERGQADVLKRQLQLDPDTLALQDMGITGPLAGMLKQFAKTGDYGNGTMSVPNYMPDGTMNLANSSYEQPIKPTGWDDNLAKNYLKRRAAFDYGISMGEKNPQNIQKSIGEGMDNNFVAGAGDDPLQYGVRKAAVGGKPEDVQTVQLLQKIAERGGSQQELEAAARALILGKGKDLYDFSKDGVGNNVTGGYTENPGPFDGGGDEKNWVYDTGRGVLVNKVTGQAKAPTLNGKPIPQPPKKTIDLSGTAQKELFEADDMAQAAQNTIDMLKTAQILNKKAFSGFGASSRAWADKAIPNWLGGDEERAAATVELDNIMQTQALEALKSTFGGSPTEGERKILLEIQASSEKTPAQRASIIRRAMAMADRRRKVAAEKAKALRSGTFFTQDREIQGGALEKAPPAGAPAPKARTVVKTGMYKGRRVVQYSDGTMEYAK